MSATDDSDPSGRLAPRDASRLDDALDVARFFYQDARGYTGRARSLSGELGVPMQRMAIAAAERVLVERGLGLEYIRQLAKALHFVPAPDGHRYSETDTLILVTAPLDARLRALARVVREQQPKEKA